jgi:hypothetical protein
MNTQLKFARAALHCVTPNDWRKNKGEEKHLFYVGETPDRSTKS